MRIRLVYLRVLYINLMIANSLQLSPHVKYVMDKFKHKLPKDDLKRYAKEVSLHPMLLVKFGFTNLWFACIGCEKACQLRLQE